MESGLNVLCYVYARDCDKPKEATFTGNLL